MCVQGSGWHPFSSWVFSGSAPISQPPRGDREARRLPHSPDFSHELGFPTHLWKLLWGLPVPSDLTFHDDVALWVFLLPLCWELGGPFQSAKLCHLASGFLELFPFSLFFLELLLVKY